MPNNDLISRKALLKRFEELKNNPNNRLVDIVFLDGAMSVIDAAPAVDAVEVVRCKDCKFSKPLKTIPSYRYCIALKDVINFGDDFYCARGVKMED